MIYNLSGDCSYETLSHQIVEDETVVGVAGPAWARNELAGRIRLNLDIVVSGEHYRVMMDLLNKLSHLQLRYQLEGSKEMSEAELHAPGIEEPCEVVVNEDGSTKPGTRYVRRVR